MALTDPLPASAWPPADAESLIALAREHRLDLRAMHQAVLAGDAEIQLEYLQVFPEISVGVGAERTEGRNQPGRNIPADFARWRPGQLALRVTKSLPAPPHFRLEAHPVYSLIY